MSWTRTERCFTKGFTKELCLHGLLALEVVRREGLLCDGQKEIKTAGLDIDL